MKTLYSLNTQTLFPYPRLDDESVIGLSPDLVVLDIVELPSPDYDPETEYLSETWIVDVDALEYQKTWTVQPSPESAPPLPNWDGLYQTLILSAVYNPYLSGLALQFNAVDSALDKTIAAIGYGDRYPDSALAYGAFQQAVNLLLYALGSVNQALTTEQLTDIRTALDTNGFEGIVL